MRPGEVIRTRTFDLDTSGKVWVYRPESHKTEHHGKSRQIFLGPRAQDVLKPWLKTNLSAYLFSPREAMEELRSERRRNRKTRVQPSQQNRRKRSPKRSYGDRYTRDSYRRAIAKGCEKAGVPHWHPNQLRHNAATWLRKEFCLDVARAVLGHSDADTTTIYAERDAALAAGAMERLG